MKTFSLKQIPLFVYFALGYFLLLGLISIILGQDVSWDLRNYHFYNPYMLLTGRIKYDILPAQIQTFFNPLMDIPFFISVYYLKIPPIIIGFLLGGIHGINIFFIHYITYFSLANFVERTRHFLSGFAAITSLCGAAYLSELGTSIGDSTSSLFVLGGLLTLIYSLSKYQKLTRKSVLLTGLLVGLGVGLKLTVALYAISLIAAINFVKSSWAEKIRKTLMLMVSMFVGFLITMGYWMVLMWKNFGNPLFPFFNKVFKSPYIETHDNLKDLRFLPRDFWQGVFYPFHFLQQPTLVAELEFRDAKLAVAYILIVSLIVTWLYRVIRHQKINHEKLMINLDVLNLLIPFYTAAYLIWLTQFSIYRYLITLELLTPVLIILIIGYIFYSYKQILFISILIFVSLIVTVQPLDWGRNSWNSSYFGIDKNALVNYENATIIMWGDEPTSYLVPHFPQTTRFVRIKGNSGLNENTLMYQNGKKFIYNTPVKSLYFLQRTAQDSQEQRPEKSQDLSNYSLQFAKNDCHLFSSSIKGEDYQLCSLEKK
jgi:hypothetical protein